MNAQTIFRMMKPHLDLMNASEKAELSNLITALPSHKVCCHHRKVLTPEKAKKHLQSFCKQQMQLENARFKPSNKAT